MIFKNRTSAAQQLAICLGRYKRQNALILALPRAAVPMAKIIADELQGELGVVMACKIELPNREDCAIAAVSERGFVYHNPDFASRHIPEALIKEAISRQLSVMGERRRAYRLDQKKTDPAGRITILVDDGIETGSTLFAAIHELRSQKPAKLIVAAPVAPPDTARRMELEVDELIVLDEPVPFYTVAQFYEDFDEVADQEVMQALWGIAMRAARPRPREIQILR